MSIELRSDFPGGNGLAVEIIDHDLPVVRFAAEPRNCPQPMWFHIRLQGLGGRSIRCALANAEQTLGGWDWSTNRPVWRVADTGQWHRADPPEKYPAPGGRIEWAWTVPNPGDADAVEFAHCYPYQPADFRRTLSELPDGLEEIFLGLSSRGRIMSAFATHAPDAAPRPAALVIARQHAGEVPGSWVADGLLRHVMHAGLHEAIQWVLVPFVNFDDVVEGSYGKDPWPHDCNRAWGGAFRPEVGAVMELAYRLSSGPAGLKFLADLHAPNHRERANYIPVRGWTIGSTMNPIAREFGDKLRASTPEDIRSPIAHVTPEQTNPRRYPGETATTWARETLGVDGACIETSYQGTERRAYVIEDYRRFGSVVAETIAEWVHQRRD